MRIGVPKPAVSKSERPGEGYYITGRMPPGCNIQQPYYFFKKLSRIYIGSAFEREKYCGFFFAFMANPILRDPRDPKAEEEEESPPPIFLPSAVPYSFRSGAEEGEEEEEEEEEDGGDDVSRLED